MSIAGHVSRAMLSRYSHVRMEAERRALEAIVPREPVPNTNSPMHHTTTQDYDGSDELPT